MDQFDLARERAEKSRARLGRPPADQPLHPLTPPVIPQEKAPEVITPRPFTRLAIALDNGTDTHILEFECPDFLENMMHSDRTPEGIRLKFYQILKAHLTSNVT